MIPRDARCGDDELIGMEPAAAIIRTAQGWAHDNLVPLNVSLEITLACNIRCVHCYNFDRNEPLRRAGGAEVSGSKTGCAPTVEKPELTTDAILRLIGEVREAGCLFLSLTGGEVLSHPDLFLFLERARDLNLAVQLLTNGTLLRPGIAKRLASYTNLMGVSVSLYGATPEVHDSITQVKGSFARTWAGVERLRAAGVTVRLKFIVMRQNAHETQAMMDGATARDFPYLVDMTVTARHDGTSGSLDAQIDRGQLETLCRGPLRALLPAGRRSPSPSPAKDFNCNCARGNCAISARGEVYPCISVPWSAGNVGDRPFRDIWRDSPVFNRIRGLTLDDFSKCAPCPHRGYCSHDRGAAFNTTGDYTGADPFVCATAEIAHALADEAEIPSDRAERESVVAHLRSA
ncbi:MAG: radical SAM protein [Deltaproteobacteria bacterium]|nr:radical SAM protein [Deltaproteobacteria bacterium]